MRGMENVSPSPFCKACKLLIRGQPQCLPIFLPVVQACLPGGKASQEGKAPDNKIAHIECESHTKAQDYVMCDGSTVHKSQVNTVQWYIPKLSWLDNKPLADTFPEPLVLGTYRGEGKLAVF